MINADRCSVCGCSFDELECCLTKIQRWPNDKGVWQCDDCTNELEQLEDLDLDDYEERKRRRIQEENAY